jgi:hypothetical protein
MQDWCETVDWLRDKINAPGLTLRLVVAEVSDFTPDCYRPTITFEEGRMIMSAYKGLLRPLAQLADNGLARFYADLVHPWELAERSNSDHTHYWNLMQRRKKKIKEFAERRVMGDRYESLSANDKEEPEPSSWTESYYSHWW